MKSIFPSANGCAEWAVRKALVQTSLDRIGLIHDNRAELFHSDASSMYSYYHLSSFDLAGILKAGAEPESGKMKFLHDFARTWRAAFVQTRFSSESYESVRGNRLLPSGFIIPEDGTAVTPENSLSVAPERFPGLHGVSEIPWFVDVPRFSAFSGIVEDRYTAQLSPGLVSMLEHDLNLFSGIVRPFWGNHFLVDSVPEGCAVNEWTDFFCDFRLTKTMVYVSGVCVATEILRNDSLSDFHTYESIYPNSPQDNWSYQWPEYNSVNDKPEFVFGKRFDPLGGTLTYEASVRLDVKIHMKSPLRWKALILIRCVSGVLNFGYPLIPGCYTVLLETPCWMTGDQEYSFEFKPDAYTDSTVPEWGQPETKIGYPAVILFPEYPDRLDDAIHGGI